MKTFEYVAWDYSGNCKEGVRQAPSEDELLTYLRSEELTPAVINEVVGTLKKKKDEIRYKKVKSMELATFCWQLNTMLSGGLSITVAIQTIADEIENPYFEYLLKNMSQQIEKGMSFTDCVRQYPKVFGKLCCAIIMAGETGGSLTASLERLAEHYENRDKLIRKVRGAMAYPAFVVAFIVVIVIVLMTLIIPRFSLMFEEFNGELPAFTRGFMAVYDLIASHTLHIVICTAGLVLGLMAYVKTKAGHEKFCQFMLSVPVFGKIILMSFVAMFCKTLGTLIGAGVSLLDAFSILAEMTNNDLLRRGVLETREKMAEGKNISQSMDEVGFFPGVAVKMAQIGENSGSLGTVMEKTSEYYEKKVDGLVSLMLGMLEPVLIITVGGIVLVVILAMYLPIFSMSV
jgi:type IV pilus assembly protein PilC